MIKYVANEPSVGLYFVQQHAQASMPLLLDVKNPTWGFQSGKSSGTWEEDLGITDGGSSRNYFSSMFNTAKQKASTLRWPQPDFGTKDDTTEESESSAAPESSQAGGHGASTPSDTEKDDLPVSSQLLDNNTATMKESSSTDISKSVENYNKFKEEQELKLQEWLRQSEEADDNKE
ncbi:hypothetical protein OsI_27811 [Oryza sativa Indica Group]|uniref:Uncharacterized protein n=1 Tax=Oryza sativa subsp. indica TaxID=39946 RepID=B8BAQ2_ORYSI|nr:hypothetical protein OsI_27811 [Oryza sativa Indica Group]